MMGISDGVYREREREREVVERRGEERRGEERKGKERKGKERKGKERKGKKRGGGCLGEGRERYGGTRVTVVGVGFCGTFCDFEIAFVGHLVEGALAAAEELAGVAVAGISC